MDHGHTWCGFEQRSIRFSPAGNSAGAVRHRPVSNTCVRPFRQGSHQTLCVAQDANYSGSRWLARFVGGCRPPMCWERGAWDCTLRNLHGSPPKADRGVATPRS